ncbi:MAG: hypothetical protein AAB403_16490 [Planctomycetota bacterium]
MPLFFYNAVLSKDLLDIFGRGSNPSGIQTLCHPVNTGEIFGAVENLHEYLDYEHGQVNLALSHCLRSSPCAFFNLLFCPPLIAADVEVVSSEQHAPKSPGINQIRQRILNTKLKTGFQFPVEAAQIRFLNQTVHQLLQCPVTGEEYIRMSPKPARVVLWDIF